MTRCTLLHAFLAVATALSAATAPERNPGQESSTSFPDAARTVSAAIQKNFYDEKTGLYSRGADDRSPEFMWGNGVMFSSLVAAARHEPATYRPLLDRFFVEMDRYWDAKAAPPGYEPAPTAGDGHDKYYDDNQWMVITFAEAYEVTGDARYLDRSQAALKFSLSGWDDHLEGGIWWHEKHKAGSKNTCANAPAAVACLRVGRWRDTVANIDWAQKLVAWTAKHLQDRDGLFFDNKRVDNGRVDRKKYTYNSALMLRANLGLYRATGDAAFLAEAKRIGVACQAFDDPKKSAYRDGKKFSHLLVEADLELYRATGDATLLARARRNGEAAWSQWRSSPPKELIEQAAIARMLWLLADHETEAGRAFWSKADAAPAESGKRPSGASNTGERVP
ncbi:MAG TPA: glycoside hydrolase family 76 protein [Phycisphaerales bacterium]|nr:glycoside hydrolase family 76 protein [Phycisphaerales bacterium]